MEDVQPGAAAPEGITWRIALWARELGFIGAGFSRPERPAFMEEFCRWIRSGRHGGMAWLARGLQAREDPARLLRGCRTIISLAYPYPKEKPATPEGLTTARYSRPWTEDYHTTLKCLCGELSSRLKRELPESRTRICVDSAPILERSAAVRAGLGFIGRNNMLIVPEYGSYVFLAEILTTAELQASQPQPVSDQCGSCTRCLDACPTGALEAPFSMDASKCLSYLTVESSEPVGPETGSLMGDCFLGCDCCQEVCPYNGGAGAREVVLPVAGAFLEMSEEAFSRRFGHTALARPGLAKIQSNLRALIASREPRLDPG
ncbi:MAG: tRNA epoxyqueuosine(34) reductase QueG [Desulfobacteraceae bacterium]